MSTRIEARELQQHIPAYRKLEQDLASGIDRGPQPWCRLCNTPVDHWQWMYDRSVERWRFVVQCHDQWQVGHVRESNPFGCFKLECFAYTAPHTEENLWWVTCGAHERMLSPEDVVYIHNASRFYDSTIGTFIRKNGDLLGLLLGGGLMLLLRQLF